MARTSTTETPALTFKPVTKSTFADFVALFEGRGGPKHCYCLVWRERGAASKLDLAGRRKAMRQRVEHREPIGILAYLDGAPVGWCSIAPRETYRPLGGEEYAEGTQVWSLVCFFVQAKVRGEGLGRALLDEAIRVAQQRGADVIEAYPVDPDSPSYRFSGFTSMFRAAGFEERGRAGTRRHVMRLRVSSRTLDA
jgi:GNAT superfamily N-acetyltransferase